MLSGGARQLALAQAECESVSRSHVDARRSHFRRGDHTRPAAEAVRSPAWLASCCLVGEREKKMDLLWALAFVFVVLWALGFLAFHVTTGFIHMLLVVAVVVVVFRLISGRRTA
jgi:Flp pilus assembly protein TadB